jgi:hypothetical protein
VKELNMKRRAFFGPAALLFAGLAGGAPAAHAADTAVPVTGTVSGQPETVSFSAQPLVSSAQAVSAQAPIASGQPESVSFSGQARISSRLVPDPDFGRPSILLRIDLSGLSGVGASTGARYVVSSKELVQRRLAGSHVVVINFPFTASNGAGTPQSAVASFALDFDFNTGAVTKATGTILTPNF